MAKKPELRLADTHDEQRRDAEGVVELVVADESGDTEAPIEGEQFGKYTLIGELAVGGMAEVYLGIQQGLQGYLKVVTIKRMLPHLNGLPEYVTMFFDEARLGARLEHPNIVRTYEFGEHDGQYFTVMEYLPGEDLVKILNRASATKEPLPLNIGVYIAMQICSGLHFAHELTDTEGKPLGLVHRDVNPSNVIITYGGEVKLIDFGVAKATTNASQTLAGTIKGKLAYMSPEQVLGHELDRRSDVFSTGVVLWELLTARPLFARENEAATLYSIMNDPIPNVRQFRPDVPRELDAMVARALARSPADRFESCETMLYALESFLNTQPKVDVRLVARMLEDIFGTTRANAKRSIAQTRSLRKNVSLVMKLRTDVRRDLAENAKALQAEQPVTRAKLMFATLGIVLLAAVGGAGFFVLHGDDDPPVAVRPAGARLELATTPPGAAILLGSEPTGLKTPATLQDLPAGTLSVRLVLDGHRAVDETLSLQAGERAQRTFALVPLRGRLVLGKLPRDAEVWVDGNEVVVGEVIDVLAGKHDVRIDVGGVTIVRQTVETSTGHQVWELETDTLVRR